MYSKELIKRRFKNKKIEIEASLMSKKKKKMGYKVEGIPFEIKGVGEHIVMFKEIAT